MAGDLAKTGNKSAVPLIGVLLDYWHRVTGVGHLRKDDQLGAEVFCPARKIVNLGQIRFRIAERTRNLGDCDFHSIATRIWSSAVVCAVLSAVGIRARPREYLR